MLVKFTKLTAHFPGSDHLPTSSDQWSVHQSADRASVTIINCCMHEQVTTCEDFWRCWHLHWDFWQVFNQVRRAGLWLLYRRMLSFICVHKDFVNSSAVQERTDFHQAHTHYKCVQIRTCIHIHARMHTHTQHTHTHICRTHVHMHLSCLF